MIPLPDSQLASPVSMTTSTFRADVPVGINRRTDPNMHKTSSNIIFIYSLLIVDLLVNITDNLLSPTIASQDAQQHESISKLSISIIIVQVVAVICVIINLVLHFFEASDQVRRLAWLQQCSGTNDGLVNLGNPMPRRVALKLVLDRYWWSLVVGLLYLVLTIILQIVRLDSSLYRSDSLITSSDSSSISSGTTKKMQDLTDYQNWRSSAKITLGNEDKLFEAAELYHSSFVSGSYSLRNLLPTVVLLIHKLISTCYYVSFVVVYRISPSHMGSRILNNKATQNDLRRPNN